MTLAAGQDALVDLGQSAAAAGRVTGTISIVNAPGGAATQRSPAHTRWHQAQTHTRGSAASGRRSGGGDSGCSIGRGEELRRAGVSTPVLMLTAKAAEITHGNLVANCELQRAYIGSGDDDVALGVLPWFHITGMECQMNMMAYLGATLVALGRFDIDTVLTAIQKYRVTLTTFIATINVAIVNYPKTRQYDLSSLRTVGGGGAI